MPAATPACVLVVDDDDLVRQFLGTALRLSGFAVRLADGGHQAVAIYRDHGGDTAAVLLDVRMPGMDGPATLLALRALNPAVRCCFMSGYTEASIREELLALGAEAFFHKPFNMAEVTRALREVLGQPPEGR